MAFVSCLEADKSVGSYARLQKKLIKGGKTPDQIKDHIAKRFPSLTNRIFDSVPLLGLSHQNAYDLILIGGLNSVPKGLLTTLATRHFQRHEMHTILNAVLPLSGQCSADILDNMAQPIKLSYINKLLLTKGVELQL